MALRESLRGLSHAEMVQVLLALPFFTMGWLAGKLVACILWIVAATVAGYKAGMVE